MNGHAVLLGMLIDNYRNNGTINASSAMEVIRGLADTNLPSSEIASAFTEHFMEASSSVEVETGDDNAIV